MIVLLASAWAQEAGQFVPPALEAPFVVEWPRAIDAGPAQGPISIELELLVDETGRVEGAEVLAGSQPFAEIARKQALGLRFSPATDGGVPVAVRLPMHVVMTPPPVNVTGVIRMAGGGRIPAAGLLVRIGTQSQLTDGEGRFAFRGIRPGPHQLLAGDTDAQIEPQVIEVGTGEALELELWARPSSLDAGIVGTYRIERDEVLRRSLTSEEVRTTPGTMGDPIRAISNLPGAVRTPLDSGWLLIRGGDPRNTGVYVDGMRVPLIYHLGGFTSVVNPGYVERVDFYPGGQSARYGRATAGAVDLITRSADRAEARVGANIIQAGAYVAAPVGKGGVSAAVRRSYLDGVLDLVPGVTTEQAGIAPRFWDWQGQAGIGRFSLFTMGFVDSVDASTASGQEAAIRITTQRVHGGWDGEILGKPILVKPWISWQRDELGIAVLDLVQLQQSVAWGARVELADDEEAPVGWSAGADVSFDWFGFRYNSIERYAHLDSPDAYADMRFGQETKWILGLRLDTLFVTDQIPRAAVSPRAAAELPVGRIFTVILDGGVYHQPPPSQLVMGPPEGSALSLERSWGLGGGLRVDMGPTDLDVDVYGRHVDDIAAFEEDGSLGAAQGQVFGLETRLRYQAGRAAGWVAYAYSRSNRREEADESWVPSDYDQPHTANVVGALDLGRNWTLAGRWRFASGFPLPERQTVNAYDVLEQQSVPLLPSIYGRTDPFHALDLKIARQAIYRSWHLDFYLDVQNVYNRRVAEPVISGVWELYGAQTYGFGLPVLPILGIEGVFGG